MIYTYVGLCRLCWRIHFTDVDTKWFLHASVNERSYFPAYEPSYIIKVCWLVLMCSTLSVLACVIIAIVSFRNQLFIICQWHEELTDGFPFNFWCICLYLLYFLDLLISIDIRHQVWLCTCLTFLWMVSPSSIHWIVVAYLNRFVVCRLLLCSVHCFPSVLPLQICYQILSFPGDDNA